MISWLCVFKNASLNVSPLFSLGTSSRPHNSSQSASNLSARATKRPRKRRANFPMEKLMEQFLEQSVQAEENFYRMEEQRLQAEDRRREAEHARELHMLQMLGQMFSSISRPGSAATPSKTAPATVFSSASPSCSRGQSSHLRRPSPQPDCFPQKSQLSNPDPQALGIGVGVIFSAWKANEWRDNWKLQACQLFCKSSVMKQWFKSSLVHFILTCKALLSLFYLCVCCFCCQSFVILCLWK